jgi:MurNAc alpha-1-phosphate uridylyltransferase
VKLFTVAILAGGLATRLRPITERVPKALVEIAGRPFIHHQLRLLAGQGVTRVVLCVGYLGEMVRAVVGDGSSFGLLVEYSYDGEVLLGTGGALRRALPLLGDRFFVLYGDTYLPSPLAPVQEAYIASGAGALMAVLRNSNRWDKSNALYLDGRVIEYNKHAPKAEMHYIDYGLGVLRADVLNTWPSDQPFDLADVYQSLAQGGRLAGFEVEQRFYEIGSPAGIRETEQFLSARGGA